MDFGALFAAVVITVIPVLIVYLIFQRQLQGSVSAGHQQVAVSSHVIGIIGQGRMAREHAGRGRTRGQDIRYVCAPGSERPLEHAASARFVTDLDVVLADPQVDIVLGVHADAHASGHRHPVAAGRQECAAREAHRADGAAGAGDHRGRGRAARPCSWWRTSCASSPGIAP